MVVAAETFQVAYEQVVSKYQNEAKQSILTLITEIAVLHKPYMVATAKGPEELTNLVFGNEGTRDFILSLSYSFFARFQEGNDPCLGLAASLTRGLILNSLGAKTFIPDVIVNGNLNARDTEELLGSNQWLMTWLMIQLFVTPTVA